MIDLHVHILPGLDDGSQTLEDSLEMAELALEGGTRIVVATPHSNQEGRFENYNSSELKQVYQDFCLALNREKLPLRVLPGMEIFASEDMGEKISGQLLFGMNHTQYFLVEFPFDAEPWWIGERLEEIQDEGKIPLVAHPERYYCVWDYPGLVYQWIQMGCRIQTNKGSILGRFGRHVYKTADILLKNNLVTCVASDAHSPVQRTPYMGEVQEYLERYFGEERAYRLLSENPGKIIVGKQIPVHGTLPKSRRWKFW